MQFSEQSTSVWKATQTALETEPLRASTEADVCVVGAGIVGMSVAYELSRSGQNVVLLDDNAIGGGETAQTTAHLASALDDRYFELERLHGLSTARLVYRSHAAAIRRIEAIVQREHIACDFQRLDGHLFLGEQDSPRTLERELEAAQRVGFDDVELLARAPLTSFDTGPCLRFGGQAQMHPLRYLAGLATAIGGLGGRIFTSTHVAEIHEHGAPHVVVDGGLTVRARSLVIATNTPVNDRFAIHTKQQPYRSFVIALQVPDGAVAPGLYWDTAEPYHYLRLHQSAERGALLIVGGEDHKTGHRDDATQRFADLERWTRARFPMAGALEHRWSGQVLEPIDRLAFIGRNPGSSHVFIATGDSGNGMTYGAIAGMLIRDLVMGGRNAWTEVYDPARKTLRAAGEYVRGGAAVALSYADWLKHGDVATVEQIPRGSGAVVQRGIRKLAVYRGQSGLLSVCSALCPHLGGVVHWNSEERSWDCPCHGSRFSPNGQVLNGPALHGLQPVSLDDAERVPAR